MNKPIKIQQASPMVNLFGRDILEHSFNSATKEQQDEIQRADTTLRSSIQQVSSESLFAFLDSTIQSIRLAYTLDTPSIMPTKVSTNAWIKRALGMDVKAKVTPIDLAQAWNNYVENLTVDTTAAGMSPSDTLEKVLDDVTQQQNKAYDTFKLFYDLHDDILDEFEPSEEEAARENAIIDILPVGYCLNHSINLYLFRVLGWGNIVRDYGLADNTVMSAVEKRYKTQFCAVKR